MSVPIYFITGGTGFLGGEFLQTLLAKDPKAQCYCLVRDQGQQLANQRLAHERLTVIPGDITLEQFGLSNDQYQTLAQKITHIVHTAAMVKFEKPKTVLETINVLGTKNVVSFAKTCQQLNPKFQVLGHVGTAYVAGKRQGRVSEQDFTDVYGFKNNYESTKYAAEGLLHEVKSTLPVIIFRPSIILGHSANGRVARSNVIFPLVQVAKKYALGLVPFNKHCLMDFVPVDYVAQGIYCLLQEEAAIGQTFHLSCGMGNEVSIQQMLYLFNQTYQMRLRTIPSGLWPISKPMLTLTRHGRYLVQGMDPYWLYTLNNPQFCSEYTKSMLNKYQLSCDNMTAILQKTLVYMEQHFFN